MIMFGYHYDKKPNWSSGMIPPLGGGGPEFESLIGPYFSPFPLASATLCS